MNTPLLLLMKPLLHALSVCLLLGSSWAQAEFILFPSFTATDHAGLNPHPDVQHAGHTPKQSELNAALDLFYSADKGRLRLLAEAVISSDEPLDIERLQVGWLAAPETTVWLGRHHSPLGYWGTQFHHGAYLQTSIQRPAISTFDDHGGILPTHLSGLFIEEQHAQGDGSIGYALSFGASPTQGDEGTLEAFDLAHPNQGTHKPGALLRLSYRPDAAAPGEAGVFMGHATIASELASVNEIKQSVAGAFFNREQGRWRWIGELYGVRNDLTQPAGNARSSFVNANLQGEYGLRTDWTLYGRAENTFGDRNGPFLMHFPNFAKERYLLGVRYELSRNQALKLEFSDSHVLADSYSALALQWSAALP